MALPDGERLACVLKGRSLRIAVGDNVAIERTRDGAAITGVEPRRNLVYRSDAFKEKLVAANVTQVAAVVAPDIAVDEDLLNRWMIAAEAAHCRYVVFANKRDLPSFAQLRTRLAPYEALGYPLVPISAKRDIADARTWLDGQHTVLVGQSGMGKSTLINALLPDAQARTMEVSEALKSGRHTTSSTTLYVARRRFLDRGLAGHEGLRTRSHSPPTNCPRRSSRCGRSSGIAGFAIAATGRSRAARSPTRSRAGRSRHIDWP